MLTAAVRDLHLSYPGQFLTDLRTAAGELWENNPYVTKLRDDEVDEDIYCEYPLIHQSNEGPWHFIHGFRMFLNERLGLNIKATKMKGDIHLSEQEKGWISQVEEITGRKTPFWIIVAGGKSDYTIKSWSHARWQAVVDAFQGKVQFVQVGEAGHMHPPLEGVIDLRGKTDLRQLVRLVYHSDGVVCPVTLLMHLAAAVEVPPGRLKNRACVVVAGGREPAQWEQYPHHQYIHRNGTLRCCDNGGCWKSRVVPLGDGDPKDQDLCLDVVHVVEEERKPASAPALTLASQPRTAIPLPRCMDGITIPDVARAIEVYLT